MKTNSIPRLPAVVKRYFEASNRRDVAATADCFTRDAAVEDQFGRHDGRAAIQQWIEEITRKYQPTFVLLKPAATEADMALTVSVSGHFPGSPVQLDFHFRLRCRKIAAMTIE
jgi:ketosteroid isomerase-like protein